MVTPVLELEGTWEEIAAKVPDYQDTPLQVTIQVKGAQVRLTEEEKERHLKILHEVYETISQFHPKPDNRDWLREAREGGMIRESLLK